MKTYLFYDIETSGLNPCFDQVLQFAAIRTDETLNEISRHEIWVKPTIGIIPAMEAMITHQLPLDRLQNEGLSEYEATKQIHALFNTPGTVSLGYNTLGFDDEFLRFSFYRHLLTPYTHQFSNDCGRMDLFPMTVFYYLFKNDCLNWPMRNDKISLKLDCLGPANNLMQGHAHNAMVDVEATLNLAKLLQRESEMWHYLCDYFNKNAEIARLKNLSGDFGVPFGKQGLMIEGVFGADVAFQVPVLYLGPHDHYKNRDIWLRLDQPDLLNAKADDFVEHTYSISKKMGEPPFLLPLKPRLIKFLSKERLEMVRENLAFLKANPALLTAMTHHYCDFKFPEQPQADLDAKLYQQKTFPSNADLFLCRQFHQAAPPQKAKILENFESTLFKQLGIRLLGRHFREYLPDPYQQEFEDYLNHALGHSGQAMVDFKNQVKLTLHQAKTVCQNYNQETLDEQQKLRLKEFVAFLEGYPTSS